MFSAADATLVPGLRAFCCLVAARDTTEDVAVVVFAADGVVLDTVVALRETPVVV